jgi:transcriptional regulator with XRE-family HTH domain
MIEKAGMPDYDADPRQIDRHIGERIRTRRQRLDITQEILGRRLGVSFQQIQKFEKGANRIAAAQLFGLADVLKVEISYFFDGLVDRSSLALAEDARPFIGPSEAEQTLELNSAFAAIEDPLVRSKIVELAKALAEHPRSAS